MGFVCRYMRTIMNRLFAGAFVASGLLLQACVHGNTENDSASAWRCQYYSSQNCSDTNHSGNGTGITPMQWAKTASGDYDSFFKGATIDGSNNIFAAGTIDLNTPYTFGPGITVSGDGASYNAVLVKYNLSGTPQWARVPSSANGMGSDFPGVAADSSGSIYAVGFQESGVFTYGAGVSATGPGSSSYPVIVKYSGAGTALWARTISTGASGAFKAVAIDSSGNIYAAGNQAANSSHTYGIGVVSIPPSAGSSHAVLVKYDSNGTAQWARTITSATNQSSFENLAVDNSGNIYAVGYQNGNAAVSYATGINATGPATGSNAVLVKYDLAGNAQWARSANSGASTSAFSSIAKDNAGNIYVTGNQNGNSAFAYGNGVTATGPAAGAANAVLLKYAPDGTPQWAKTVVTATMSQVFRTIAVLSSGDIYVAGYQAANAAYTYGTGVTAQSTTPYDNALIVKYNASGTAQWAKTTVLGDFGSNFGAIVAANNGLLVGCGYQNGNEPITYLPGVEATGNIAGGASYTAVIVRYQ